MKTIEPTWRNLAKGYDKVLAHETLLQAELTSKMQQAQRQKYQADMKAWESRQKQRERDHEIGLSVWNQKISDQRSHLHTMKESGIRRAPIIAPASAFVFVVAGLIGDSGLNAIQLIFLGIIIGTAISFAPAGWSGMILAHLQSEKPVLDTTRDPKPEIERPIHLSLVDQWWQQISDNGTYRRKDHSDYGDEGETKFYRHLAQTLPNNHVGIRGILVKPRLDVDVLVVGPTNVWIFEVKHWTGTISCRNGTWRRTKTYYEPGGYPSQKEVQIKPFDRQWMSEQREVKETLRRHVRPSRLADQVTGGLVFTFPGVVLDIEQSQCGWGVPDYWVPHIQQAAAKQRETISQRSRLKILDALLDRAEHIDHRHNQRRCCIELADRLAHDMRTWAEGYIARHAGF
jgi:Nuclease-related domain